MRAYCLRGIFTRLAHLAVTLNLVDRVRARNSDRFASHLGQQIAEKETELNELREKLDAARGP